MNWHYKSYDEFFALVRAQGDHVCSDYEEELDDGQAPLLDCR